MKYPLLLCMLLVGATSGEVPCGRLTLDFDRFGERRGDYISNRFYQHTLGIDHIACRKAGREGRCRIFDTNVPVGRWRGNSRCNCGPADERWPNRCWDWQACGDPDLNPHGQNLGNVLIIDEHQNSYQSSLFPPNDFNGGGTFVFNFVQPVTVHEIAFMDTEECTRPAIKFIKSTGSHVVRKGPETGNNGYAVRQYNEQSVKRLEITLFGSGAIAFITFTAEECRATAPPPTTTQGLPTPNAGTLPVEDCHAFLYLQCFIADQDGQPTNTDCKDHFISVDDDCEVDSVLVYTLTNTGNVDLQVDSAEGTLNGGQFDFTSHLDGSNPLAARNCTTAHYPVALDFCNTTVIEVTGFIDASSTPSGGTCEAITQLSFRPRNITSTSGTLPTTASANGDPHIHRWNQERYSFQGECDLVLVHSDQFHGDGLDLHLRTTIKDYYSYVEAVALRLGHHILEFRKESVVYNGLELHDDDLPISFGEKYAYNISYRIEFNRDHTRKKKFYIVELGEQSSMELKFYRHFGSVEIAGHPEDFSDSTGLSGAFPSGDMLGRDGRAMKKSDAYGFEWQVDPSLDPSLFVVRREPQLPTEKCRMPTVKKTSMKKLRGAAKALYKQAKQACRDQTGDDLEACIDDVLATGDAGLGLEWK